MPEVTIITDTVGNETFASGGLIAKYSKVDHLKDQDKPYVIYTVISDYEDKNGKYISKQQQYDEVERASKLLGFNWEVMWEGRSYKNNFTEQVSHEELDKQLLNRLDFLKPSTVITSSWRYGIPVMSTGLDSEKIIKTLNTDITSYVYPNFPIRKEITDSINRIRRNNNNIVFNLIHSLTFEEDSVSFSNQFLSLTPSEIDLKRKAMLCYKSYLGDDITYVDRLIEFHKSFKNKWGCNYIEPYQFIEGLIY